MERNGFLLLVDKFLVAHRKLELGTFLDIVQQASARGDSKNLPKFCDVIMTRPVKTGL